MRLPRPSFALTLGLALLTVLAPARAQEPIPPTNSGPAAVAHSRTWRHRRKSVRVIRRTPEVMREDAARIKRGDLFSNWSSAAAGSR